MTSFKDFTVGKSKSEVMQSQGREGGRAPGGPLHSRPSGCATEGLGQLREPHGEVNEALLRAVAARQCAEVRLQTCSFQELLWMVSR